MGFHCDLTLCFSGVNIFSSSSFYLSLQELQKYEQFIFADHTNMIHVENVYEEILYQILLDETLKGKDDLPCPGGDAQWETLLK